MTRTKRGLFEFGELIEYWTGQHATTFNEYGCWCGLGGGGPPVDDLDA